MQMWKYKTVKEIWKYCKDNNIKMLGEGTATATNPLWAFWDEYRNNAAAYDASFKRLFSSFVPIEQEKDETIAEAATAFTAAVQGVLSLNLKKYAELYRVNVLADADYSITQNYDVTESMNKGTTRNFTDIMGQQSGSAEQKVAGFNSSAYEDAAKTETVAGSRTDTHTGGDSETYTLTRKGNIGVQTQSDMLQKHIDLWTPYEFYLMIFREIARYILLTGDC